jgi:hypothetical protein
VTYRDEIEIVREITATLLDGSVWAVAASDQDYWTFVPDKRVRVPRNYDETLSEV